MDLSLIGLLAKDGFDQRGFTGAVGPDQGHQLAAVHVQIDVLQHGVGAEPDAEMFDFQAAGPLAAAVVQVIAIHCRASFSVSMLCFMASK